MISFDKVEEMKCFQKILINDFHWLIDIYKDCSNESSWREAVESWRNLTLNTYGQEIMSGWILKIKGNKRKVEEGEPIIIFDESVDVEEFLDSCSKYLQNHVLSAVNQAIQNSKNR